MGLAAEARLARPLGPLVAAGGGTAAGVAVAVQSVIAAGATALLSFGLAGGLDPALEAGALVIPEAVIDDTGRRWAVDAALARRLGTARGSLLAGSDVITGIAAKRGAWEQTGALAVDLESGVVARVAGERGLPFAVLRAVCDPATRDLPPAALTALDAKGRIQPGALLMSILRQPGQIAGLMALGRETARARRSLMERVAAIAAGP